MEDQKRFARPPALTQQDHGSEARGRIPSTGESPRAPPLLEMQGSTRALHSSPTVDHLSSQNLNSALRRCSPAPLLPQYSTSDRTSSSPGVSAIAGHSSPGLLNFNLSNSNTSPNPDPYKAPSPRLPMTFQPYHSPPLPVQLPPNTRGMLTPVAPPRSPVGVGLGQPTSEVEVLRELVERYRTEMETKRSEMNILRCKRNYINVDTKSTP